ncbi:unnamed protein product [Prorocentrum cordatum]|uniref:ADP,ATP carrier protein n=1 Tax=Prorocentrum cordatum TaxID=2364126 RepID=A0ABN9UX82_9DINO|nr:unnamed protein product [Polarella glacialis]
MGDEGVASAPPTVGQRVYLAGTGQWWTGRHFGAVVVDVRGSDGTVKVRYTDGGFKRFELEEFWSLASALDYDAELDSWQVGQHVYIAGTGRWWAGSSFGVRIVDVRRSDSMLKVQYSDGGFKRFMVEELSALVTEQQAAPRKYEEWGNSFREGHTSQSPRLHGGVVLPSRRRDPERTAGPEENAGALAAREDEFLSLRSLLAEATSRWDHVEAHRMQGLIVKELGNPGPADPPPPREVEAARSVFGLALQQSLDRALGAGLAGAMAMTLQVGSLMWLRTTMNHQYRYGASMRQAVSTLFAEGGVPRFYRGLGPALLQGPLLRFGDTATNAGVLAFFDGMDMGWCPAWLKTVFASSLVAAGRTALLPVDTLKTIMQVEGKGGIPMLVAKWNRKGARVLFHGSAASSAAAFVSHYPWFVVFNTMNDHIPNYSERPRQLVRNAEIGFCASICSDTVSNSLRVIKTCRQAGDLGYGAIVRNVIQADGVGGFFVRGLTTRITANGISGISFSVLYKMFEEQLAH